MTKKHEKDENITISKTAMWQIVAAVFAILFIASLLTGGFGTKIAMPNNGGTTTGGTTPPANNGGNTGGTNQVDMEALIDDDPSIGPDDAEIVIIEFSDFECPYCGAAMGTHDALIQRFKSQDPTWEPSVPGLKKLAEEGKIKFIYRDFPLSGHPNAQKAAEASECADEQGMFWEYHDLLFENQAALTVPALKSYAAELDLDTDAFNECLDSGAMADEVKADFAAGAAAGVRGTPAFFVNGQLVSGAQPFSVFEQIIDSI